MQINQNFGVALHILAYLKLKEHTYVTSSDLASSIDTNPVVVRRILKELSNHNLVITKQGRYGSKINSNLESISFYDVYKVFYKENIISSKHEPNKECPYGVLIVDLVSEKFNLATTSFLEELKKITINDLNKEIKEKIKT